MALGRAFSTNKGAFSWILSGTVKRLAGFEHPSGQEGLGLTDGLADGVGFMGSGRHVDDGLLEVWQVVLRKVDRLFVQVGDVSIVLDVWYKGEMGARETVYIESSYGETILSYFKGKYENLSLVIVNAVSI